MKDLFIILLTLIILLEVKAEYSIDPFINYMQEKGLYDIITQLKHYYGNDVAIDVCKEFVPNNDCEVLVRVYIPNATRAPNEGIKTLESIIFNPDNYDIYSQDWAYYHNIIEKIKKKYNIEY